MPIFKSPIFIFLATLLLGIIAWLTFGVPEFFQTEKNSNTNNIVFYFSIGALIALCTLCWNIYNQNRLIKLAEVNENKNYAVKAYDNFVAKPAIGSLDIVDELLTTIEQVVYTNYDNSKIADDLKDIYNKTAQPKLMKAIRLCEEADSYMKKVHYEYESEFEEKLFDYSSDNATEILFIDFLRDGMKHSTSLEQRRKLLSDLREKITEKTVEVRTEVTKRAEQIAKGF